MFPLFVYILLLGVIFYAYQKHAKYFGAGSLTLLLYLAYAIISLVWFIQQGAFEQRELRTTPFLYLIFCIIVASAPILRYNESRVVLIQKPSSIIIDAFSVIYIFSAIHEVPSLIDNMQTGITLLLLDDEAGADLYAEAHMFREDRVAGGISNIFAIYYNIFTDVAILIFLVYLALFPKKKYIIIGLAIAIVIAILHPISLGGRTRAALAIMTIGTAFITMRRFLSDKQRKVITWIGSIPIVFIGVLMLSISMSRFGDRDEGVGAGTTSYVGQGNLNFNQYVFNANGTRNGDRTANTFKRLLGMSTPDGVYNVRAKYSSLGIDDGVFYTFVGDFVLDYGLFLTPFIFILFSFIFSYITKVDRGRLLMHQLIALFFCMCVVIQGGFYLFTYSFNDNLKILAFFFMYFIFNIDYVFQMVNKKLK